MSRKNSCGMETLQRLHRVGVALFGVSRIRPILDPFPEGLVERPVFEGCLFPRSRDHLFVCRQSNVLDQHILRITPSSVGSDWVTVKGSPEVENPEFKEAFDREYEDFVLSEILCQAMEENKVSVRGLAEKARVSAGFIQGIRSRKAKNPRCSTRGRLSRTPDCRHAN